MGVGVGIGMVDSGVCTVGHGVHDMVGVRHVIVGHGGHCVTVAGHVCLSHVVVGGRGGQGGCGGHGDDGHTHTHVML